MQCITCISRAKKKQCGARKPNKKTSQSRWRRKEAFFAICGVSLYSKWLNARGRIILMQISVCVSYFTLAERNAWAPNTHFHSRCDMNFIMGRAPFTCLAAAFLVRPVWVVERLDSVSAKGWKCHSEKGHWWLGTKRAHSERNTYTHISVFVANMGVCIIKTATATVRFSIRRDWGHASRLKRSQICKFSASLNVNGFRILSLSLCTIRFLLL